jgi:hypothetical protein
MVWHDIASLVAVGRCRLSRSHVAWHLHKIIHPPPDGGSDRRAAAAAAHDDPPALLSAPMSFKEQTNATDSKLMDLLWGKDKVRSARNETVRSVRACVRSFV